MDVATHPEEIVLTPAGYERLRAEYDTLVQVKLAQASRRLAEVAADADAAEAGEYLDARAELELLQERIDLLDRRLRSARVLAPTTRGGESVRLGSRVTFEDLAAGEAESYVLVSSAEADPLAGRLSNESPVGRALEGRRVGDTVDVQAPHGVRRLRVVRVDGRG